MKPFSLDTVLNHRKNLETQAIQRLVKARTEEDSVQRQLSKEKEILTTLIETLAREQTLGIEVVKLAQFEQRINLIEKQVVALQTILQNKKEAVTRAQEQLISRSKDRKIMETLQEKQDEAWQQYLNQKETATLDEIAVIFHNRE
ncbi:MAG: flagellar export protein FliJ [Proteobacteria bacterium]|nr:flagellar export protein FliJ [Pseudomonadota bacterium]MBU1649769.1 flagellar export protein FliJ [Pseudomonadota bacterium]MBU1986648.1 flagellar export protein FliJ [Pseudomonadota bacterium]